MSKGLTVGFDEQIFLAQRTGGVSRYVVDLIQALRIGAAADIDVELGWAWLPNEHAVAAGLAERLPVPDGRDLTPRNAWAYYLANVARRRRLRKAQVLHHTWYHPAFLRRGFDGVRVTTVHDMIPELYPELFDRDPHLAKAEYVAASDVVLCNSETTKADLLRIYGDVSAYVAVTPLGVDTRFRPAAPAPRGFPSTYVLFVGRRGEYKDFAVLAEAMAALPPGIELVVVGGGPWTESERALLRGLGIAGRVQRADLRDEEMPGAYAHASAFVFPSRYEGFGLPTLEAMACGTPAVLADAPSHREVGADAAVYFRPGDPEALRAAIESVFADTDVAARLRTAGLVRASQFTWRRTAELTVAAYRAVGR